MKLIKTTVRANRVEDVREALSGLNIADMTVTEVRRPGRPTDASGASMQTEPGIRPVPSALLELVVRDEIVADVIQTITRAARTEDIGDGHVSVIPLDGEGYFLFGGRDLP